MHAMLQTYRRRIAVNAIADRFVGGRFGAGDTLPIEPAIREGLAGHRTLVRGTRKTLTATDVAVPRPGSLTAAEIHA
jgi:DNA-binding FadR family transcriptional regulator